MDAFQDDAFQSDAFQEAGSPAPVSGPFSAVITADVVGATITIDEISTTIS